MTSRRDKAVILLAHGKSVTEVSDEIGVTRQTIYNWLSEDDYKRQVQDKRSLLIESISSRMASVCDNALRHLEKVTSDDDLDDEIRLKADRLVLSRLRDLYELADHEARLTRLENNR